MNKISKPHLVDFLRLADQNKWFSPRIRYASVRSKPELISDLHYHFLVHLQDPVLHLISRHQNASLPDIKYHLGHRAFLIDGQTVDVPKVSRVRPSFSIDRSGYTMSFGCQPPSPSGRSTGQASDASLMSVEQGTDDPEDAVMQTLQL